MRYTFIADKKRVILHIDPEKISNFREIIEFELSFPKGNDLPEPKGNRKQEQAKGLEPKDKNLKSKVNKGSFYILEVGKSFNNFLYFQ